MGDNSFNNNIINKTGLQPIEQFLYYGGRLRVRSPFSAKALQTDKHTGLADA